MSNHNLNEADFIRHKLFSSPQSPLAKYQGLITGKSSIFSLIKYEFITGLLGPIPGALGLFLRKIFYPLLFKRIGKGVIFGKNVTIRHPEKITIGRNVIIDDYAFLDGRGDEKGVAIGNETIIGRYAVLQSKVGPVLVGSNCNIGSNTVLASQGGIRIEDWVQLAGGSTVAGGLFKYDPSISNEFPFSRYSKGEIVIKERCFVGGHSSIQDGVTIGSCSMIGSGSVVMSNIPDNSIYIPRPGMIIGKTQN